MNLVPHFILEKHAQGQNSGQFDAAALFADISGFSAVTHSLSQHGSEAAEGMAEIMNRIFTPLVDAVYAQGGMISGFAGDAFTALFAGELAPARALAAARAIQAHLNANPVQETVYGRFPFAIKVGLGQGRVDWGILHPGADGWPSAAYFSGPAIEAAAGAEHYAQPGNLILAPGPAAALGALIQGLPAGEQGHVRLLNLAPGQELPAPAALPPPQDWPGQDAFIPANLLEWSRSVGEFRQVVTVFINLMGVKSHAELEPFVQAVFALQRQYGGHLARVDFGDKGCNLLLFWGAPVSHEDDLARALNFTLALGEYTPGSHKAGLTCCPMYAGLAGSPRRGEFTCYGDGINLAARLMTTAPWGSLWLDERLARRAGPRFVTQKIGEKNFKGFDTPQPVYALLEKQAPPSVESFQGKWIGHAAEMGVLDEFIRPLLAGERRFAGILSVEGEAGLGKSRLVSEFMSRRVASHEDGAPPRLQAGVCQADPAVRAPFNAWSYWLRAYFDQSPSESPARNKRAFGHRLDQLIAATPDETLQAGLNQGRSFLGALLDLEWDRSPYAATGPQGRYEWILTALTTLVRAESLRCPLVIRLEDAHWLDPDSLAVVQRLARAAQDAPFAILATARPVVGDRPLFADLPYRRLELSGLNPAELEELAGDVLAGPVDAGIAALLNQQAEGNPFFAEQILLFLREQNRLVQSGGTWHLHQAESGSALPSDVRLIFTSRLDSLSGEVRDLVQTAAILGREFEVRVLAQMLKPPECLPAGLKAAENSAIWSALNEIRYIFKHALLRDAAYEMQLKARRRELHRLAAESLEQLYADDLPPHFAEIAYHYQAACRQGLAAARRPAVDYLTKAGQRAARAFQNAAAVQAFGAALELLAPGESEQRWDLLLQREAVYDLTSERAAQSADLDALTALAEAARRPLEQAQVALRRANYCLATSDYPQAIAQAQAAARLAQAAGRVDLESEAQYYWGTALRNQSDHPAAAEHGQLALALARAAGQTLAEANAITLLGEVNTAQGNYPAAVECYRQALALVRASGDRVQEGQLLMRLGVLFTTSNPAASQQYYEEGLAICRATGDRSSEGGISLGLGAGYMLQGILDRARRQYEQGLAVFQATNNRAVECIARRLSGELSLGLSDLPAARVNLEQALVLAREVGDRSQEAQTLLDLARLYHAQEQVELAQTTAAQALEIAQAIGERLLEILYYLRSGHMHLEQSSPERAVERFAQAHALAQELASPSTLTEALAGLAYAAIQSGDIAQGRAALEQVMPLLAENPALNGLLSPVQTLLYIGQGWLTLGDPRGAQIIQAGHRRLQERAAKIQDEAIRRAFLENIPAHRQLAALSARLQNETLPVEAAPASPQPPAPPVPPAQPPEAQPAPPLPRSETGQPAGSTPDSAPQAAPVQSPAPVEPRPLQTPQTGLDPAALAAQIVALLSQAGQAQGAVVIHLGDIHIHIDQLVLGPAPQPQDQPPPQKQP